VIANPFSQGTIAVSMSIVNVGYRSTNFWVVSADRSRLLVDLGWPGLVGALEAELRRKDIPLREITHGFATHFHMDHAGAAQDLKNKGMRLIVTQEQVTAVPAMKRWERTMPGYTEIDTRDNLVIACADGRALLAGLGIAGDLIHTPGHSDDSVSLLLDTGESFTGDLTDPRLIGLEDPDVVLASWRTLRDRGAKTVYAGHGPVRTMPNIQQGDEKVR
jgi:glyoxylase-like metal-dependent hydrolase (beta-lactamase superfamily II)